MRSSNGFGIPSHCNFINFGTFKAIRWVLINSPSFAIFNFTAVFRSASRRFGQDPSRCAFCNKIDLKNRCCMDHAHAKFWWYQFMVRYNGYLGGVLLLTSQDICVTSTMISPTDKLASAHVLKIGTVFYVRYRGQRNLGYF